MDTISKNDSVFFEHEGAAQNLANAMENLLGFVKQSHEPTVSDTLYRSPSEEMRRAASRMEAQDQATTFARNALRRWLTRKNKDNLVPLAAAVQE